MGNREALLAGAKRCLSEKGYARTTARDIATASGVSLAAIGYHFGTKERLLNVAMVEAIGEWGDALGLALAGAIDPNATPLERFEAAWTRVLASFATQRPLWAASFESFTEIDRVPEVRAVIADAYEQGRLGITQLFQEIDPTTDDPTARAVGSFYQALLTGVLAQWLVDPARAPSAPDLADALRTIAADIGAGSASGEVLPDAADRD